MLRKRLQDKESTTHVIPSVFSYTFRLFLPSYRLSFLPTYTPTTPVPAITFCVLHVFCVTFH